MGRKKIEDQDYFEDQIAKLNYKKKVKLRIRTLKTGGYSIYLATSIDRQWKYDLLKDLKLSGKREHRKQDNNLMELARAIRDKRELEILQDGEVMLYSWKSKSDFLEYFDSITKTKPHPCNWNNTKNLLDEFTKKTLSFGKIDRAFCQRFVDFLLTKVSHNTAHVYYGTFKAAINQAVREGLLLSNPGNGIKISRSQFETIYLTLDELRILKNTPTNHEYIKNAFLFSCFTGLRYSDIIALKWSDIEAGAVIIRQQKTQTFVKVKLSETAHQIIEGQKELAKVQPLPKIFDLPVNHLTNEYLKMWVAFAGISKKITFHCARHTFATMCITQGIDIYTVSKLLGHTDVANTQRYARLTDQKRDREIDKLPKL
jgi:integrase